MLHADSSLLLCPMRTVLLLLVLWPSAVVAQGELALDSLDATDYEDAVRRLHAVDLDVDFQTMRFAFALTDAYDPYDTEPRQQRQRLNEHLYQHDAPEAALLVADSLLAVNYVDMDAHYGAGVAHDRLGHADEAAFHFEVFEGLLDSLLRTATGTEDDPFVVVRVDEEYILIAVLRLELRGQSLVDCANTQCDRMELHDPSDGGDVDLFFDVSLPFGHMRRTMGGR